MRVGTSGKRLAGAIGVALVLSSLGVVGSAPAFGHGTAKSVAHSEGEQKDQQEIVTFEADVSHLKHDFSMLPPEVNSMLMHAGSGSGPLLAAATAWEGLANELQGAASSYESITSGLTSGSQFGSASSATAAAAAPYVTWMQTTAKQAEQAAAQASQAAAAFAQSMTMDAEKQHG